MNYFDAFKEIDSSLSLEERILMAIAIRKAYTSEEYDIICCRPTNINQYLVHLLKECLSKINEKDQKTI